MKWTDPNMNSNERAYVRQLLTIDLWDGGSQDFSKGLNEMSRGQSLDQCQYGQPRAARGALSSERRQG